MIPVMTNNKDLTADFCIEIDFDKNTENAGRVFRTMSELIDTFQQLDRHLVTSIDSNIETVLLLEDIEAGSIRAWLTNKMKDVDDTALKSGDYKKIIGTYLVKAKWLIINKLEGKTRITDSKEIDDMRTGLFQLAEATEVRQLPAYSPIEKNDLLKAVEGITNSLSYLAEKDKASYETANGKASFNLEFRYIPEEIEELITKESLVSESQIIAKVKKPDYLGDSMWELRHGKTIVTAKILDLNWLKDFQNRKHDVRPGDSLKVRIKITQSYDYDHNLISTKYEILKVIEVLPLEIGEQLDALQE